MKAWKHEKACARSEALIDDTVQKSQKPGWGNCAQLVITTLRKHKPDDAPLALHFIALSVIATLPGCSDGRCRPAPDGAPAAAFPGHIQSECPGPVGAGSGGTGPQGRLGGPQTRPVAAQRRAVPGHYKPLRRKWLPSVQIGTAGANLR
jgi:hypothetical protein